MHIYKCMKKIVLTGGGTAGHCTPHLAILPHLKRKFDKIFYIGSEFGIEREIINKENIPYFFIPTTKLKRSLTPKNLLIPITLLKGIIKAKKILKELSPSVVFSKGGYVALPVVIAAHQLKIPVIAHESDLTLGLANKLSAKYSKNVLTSFKETADNVKNGKYVGPPIRSNIFNVDKNKALSLFNFKANKPILLITGGSQGAKAINDAVINNIDFLTEKFNVIHIVGKGNLYKENPSGYYQTEYMHNIENAFSVADVCISRAGSNTLFELLALKKNCLIIPLPKGNSRGDQILNADYFYKKGVINVLYQENLTANSFKKAIIDTLDKTQTLQKNLKILNVQDSSLEIARILFGCS